MTSAPKDMAAAMKAAIGSATHAPSVHNTQPWLFRIDGDRIEQYADFSRQLSVMDPTGRQLHLSCGAALHHLTVALRGGEYAATVTLLPDGSADHLASVEVSPAGDADPEQNALAAAIFERHTQREPFADHKVHHESLTRLRRAAEAEGAWLAILEGREDQITLAVLQAQADQAEIESPAYRAELRQWRCTEPALDGIPGSALPAAGSDRHSEVVIRDYALGDVEVGGASDTSDTRRERVRDERPALVILGTDADSPAQWLTAGQALSHLLLQATMLGLRASMLGQVIDLPRTRLRLRQQLRLIGEPQMVLRVGYGPRAQATPRRPVSEILI